jgi:hypothetical protein
MSHQHSEKNHADNRKQINDRVKCSIYETRVDAVADSLKGADGQC